MTRIQNCCLTPGHGQRPVAGANAARHLADVAVLRGHAAGDRLSPVYALFLSLYNYWLTDPAGRTFVGLRNYAVILTDPVWWNDFLTTLFITVVTVAIELVLGFMFAYVMLRIIRGRGLMRTAILIPYGIVTVVSAFVWRYGFAIDSGFVNGWLNLGDFNWFGERWSALFVICPLGDLEDDPFISLLLLAGLVQVPEDMQEAAQVDGATRLARLWKGRCRT